MTKTPIQWTDFSVNPFRFRNKETGKVGHHCTKISPGCKFCYSSKLQTGPYLSGLAFIEENKSKGEFFLDENVLQQVLRRKKPARIFWEDMSDMFLEDYPDEWIDRCFAAMTLTPHLTHQVLTKRGQRLREYMTGKHYEGVMTAMRHRGIDVAAIRWPLPNVWLGVSVEDQQRADERIPLLLQTPAAVRFLSVEPLLGPVDLSPWLACGPEKAEWFLAHYGDSQPLSWIIAGGESGPSARPCDVAWIRSIVQQCKAASVPCFVKQLGKCAVSAEDGRRMNLDASIMLDLGDPKGGDMEEWPADLRVREMPER
jgi:protein gp37